MAGAGMALGQAGAVRAFRVALRRQIVYLDDVSLSVRGDGGGGKARAGSACWLLHFHGLGAGQCQGP